MSPRMTMDRVRAAVVAALLAVAVVAYWTLRPGDTPKPGAGAPRAAAQNAASRELDGVDLSDSQLASVKVEPVEEREFPVEKDAVGSIGFNALDPRSFGGKVRRSGVHDSGTAFQS